MAARGGVNVRANEQWTWWFGSGQSAIFEFRPHYEAVAPGPHNCTGAVVLSPEDSAHASLHASLCVRLLDGYIEGGIVTCLYFDRYVLRFNYDLNEKLAVGFSLLAMQFGAITC